MLENLLSSVGLRIREGHGHHLQWIRLQHSQPDLISRMVYNDFQGALRQGKEVETSQGAPACFLLLNNSTFILNTANNDLSNLYKTHKTVQNKRKIIIERLNSPTFCACLSYWLVYIFLPPTWGRYLSLPYTKKRYDHPINNRQNPMTILSNIFKSISTTQCHNHSFLKW